LLNAIFVALIAASLAIAAAGGRMDALAAAWKADAKAAVELVIGLVGFMVLWLGLMRVLREAGAMAGIARALAPLMRRLFPDVPADHPAMAAMIMNLSANVLGMGNAATPFGLKAMRELETLNPHPGVATNAMALFLAINTAGVAVLPLGVIALRGELGSERDAAILLPSVLAALTSTLAAIALAKWLQRFPRWAPERQRAGEIEGAAEPHEASGPLARIGQAGSDAAIRHSRDPLRAALLWTYMLALLALALWRLRTAPSAGLAFRELAETWLMPGLMAWIALFGWSRRVDVYDAVVKGGREGLEIAAAILPFLVAVLVAVGMFRASGGLDALVGALAPLCAWIGFPAEALPMALIRPLSGSGALGVMTETMRAHGPDSFVGFLVSVINGSSETTFYVIALYFGSVRVRATRHTLLACLSADFVATLAALFWCRLFF
jgi:spore maturation protein SpmA